MGRAAAPPRLDLGEVKRSDLELSADAHYLFDTGYTSSRTSAAASSLHLLNGRGEFIDDTFVEDLLDTVSPSLDLVGGVNVDRRAAPSSWSRRPASCLSATCGTRASCSAASGRSPRPPPAPARPLPRAVQ